MLKYSVHCKKMSKMIATDKHSKMRGNSQFVLFFLYIFVGYWKCIDFIRSIKFTLIEVCTLKHLEFNKIEFQYCKFHPIQRNKSNRLYNGWVCLV